MSNPISLGEYNAYVLMKFAEAMLAEGLRPRSPEWDFWYRTVQNSMRAADDFKALAERVRTEER